ncbi:hypothetical protein MNBD_GAMMA08-724 [hydrothermal vent metagenome]|uniref:Sigma factor RpoE regulatory protein RseC n=1 Tax=hydrothermal vent metagenome TaxID=652676 RepID=A0A3B0X5N5_9ZZZZ
MIEETALVIEVNAQYVLLQTQRKSVCQSCSVKSGCGTSTLAKVVGKRSSQFTVDKNIEVQVGDEVVVGVDENALVQGSLLIYLFPIVFMMLVGVLVELLLADELITVLSVVVSFVFAIVIIRSILANSRLKKSVQPHLLRRV